MVDFVQFRINVGWFKSYNVLSQVIDNMGMGLIIKKTILSFLASGSPFIARLVKRLTFNIKKCESFTARKLAKGPVWTKCIYYTM